MWKLLIVTLALATSVHCEPQKRFDDYKVYKVHFSGPEEYERIEQLENKQPWSSHVDFWAKTRDSADIMVPPKLASNFEEFLQASNILFSRTISNVQSLLDAESPKSRSGFRKGLEWTNYHTLDEINEWLDDVVRKHPKEVTPFAIGRSFEGRVIRGVKLSYKKGNPTIFIESNIHAREWITSATITWILDQLLNSKNATVRDLAENLDWYIIPVLNVDGFVYSHEKNRMWRKSRQLHPNSANCVGVDMNRNFPFKWMSAGEGSSSDPCSETYAGPHAESEPEVEQLVRFVNRLPKNQTRTYVALHSYGQYVLTPWGHTDEEFPENYDDMLAVAKGFADATAVRYGTKFTYGSSSTVLYKVSGGSKEWAYGALGIPISYTIELRDKGQHGFILPPEQILPTAREVLDGFIGLVGAARRVNVLPNGTDE